MAQLARADENMRRQPERGEDCRLTRKGLDRARQFARAFGIEDCRAMRDLRANQRALQIGRDVAFRAAGCDRIAKDAATGAAQRDNRAVISSPAAYTA